MFLKTLYRLIVPKYFCNVDRLAITHILCQVNCIRIRFSSTLVKVGAHNKKLVTH